MWFGPKPKNTHAPQLHTHTHGMHTHTHTHDTCTTHSHTPHTLTHTTHTRPKGLTTKRVGLGREGPKGLGLVGRRTQWERKPEFGREMHNL